jgi:hypothetical protein
MCRQRRTDMGNMGYCRFENTLGDLEDCYDHMDDGDLSAIEEKAREKLIKLCEDIARDYGDMEED